MYGSAAKRLQEQLETLGYPVKTDGIYGKQTEKAIKELQTKYGLEPDGIVGPKTERTIRELMTESYTKNQFTPGNIFFRKEFPRPQLYFGKRVWNEIKGVTLHQTGCRMPIRPHAWRNLNAHIGVTSEGIVIIANDPTCKIWHAQRLSHSTIGIEIAGNFEGITGDESTLWKGGGPAAEMSTNQEEGVNAAMQWVAEQFEANGQEWKYIHAHRQSSRTRAGDPGLEIWQQIAMPWMRKTGATDRGENFKLGFGRKIPRNWNREYKNNKYW